MQLYTDASGTQGWGAYWSGRWLQRSWSTAQQTRDITWKELRICDSHGSPRLGYLLVQAKDCFSL